MWWEPTSASCHLNEFQGLRGWSSTVTGFTFSPTYLTSQYIGACGTDRMFGGYAIFGHSMYLKKIFDALPTHTSVEIVFTFFKIDSWDSEIFEVFIDTSLRVSKTIPVGVLGVGSTSQCGMTISPDYSETIDILISPHTSTALMVEFKDNLNEDLSNESWGIRDFRVYIVNSCTGGCLTCNVATPSVCLSCPFIAELISGKCVCANHFYMKTSDFVHCAICHYSCNTCNGPLKTNCQSCFADHIISGGTCVPDSANSNTNKNSLFRQK